LIIKKSRIWKSKTKNVKIAVEWKPTGKIHRDRSRKRWIDEEEGSGYTGSNELGR